LRSRGSDDSIRPAYVKETKIHDHMEQNLDKVRKPLDVRSDGKELGPQAQDIYEAESSK
jgi:hypothetical protein